VALSHTSSKQLYTEGPFKVVKTTELVDDGEEGEGSQEVKRVFGLTMCSFIPPPRSCAEASKRLC
jgi:hypothetical protein